MAESVRLREAVAGLVRDGDTVALEGFTHLIPFAAAHEVMRQKKRGLTLVRMTPDLVYDQMIGMGCARKLIFSWGGNPGVGSLHRFRDAVENGWPRPLELEEHSHAGMANRYVAGASNLPFAVLRGYVGTDLGILRPDPETREITLVSLHPGATAERAREATGWDLEVARRLDETEPPTGEELEILRDLRARTEASRQRPKS
jgi:acyl CoA:acetate/3-ketoacid CoA transferase alpha subunit